MERGRCTETCCRRPRGFKQPEPLAFNPGGWASCAVRYLPRQCAEGATRKPPAPRLRRYLYTPLAVNNVAQQRCTFTPTTFSSVQGRAPSLRARGHTANPLPRHCSCSAQVKCVSAQQPNGSGVARFERSKESLLRVTTGYTSIRFQLEKRIQQP